MPCKIGRLDIRKISNTLGENVASISHSIPFSHAMPGEKLFRIRSSNNPLTVVGFSSFAISEI